MAASELTILNLTTFEDIAANLAISEMKESDLTGSELIGTGLTSSGMTGAGLTGSGMTGVDSTGRNGLDWLRDRCSVLGYFPSS